jgi:hypothetical protein
MILPSNTTGVNAKFTADQVPETAWQNRPARRKEYLYLSCVIITAEIWLSTIDYFLTKTQNEP